MESKKMINKTSNIKRMGVKSIHYVDNIVLIEDSFSKDVNILFENKYEDIDNLMNPEEKHKKNRVEFEDIDDKPGFYLESNVLNEELKAIVSSVKNTSYVSKKLYGNIDKENINIQIKHNYDDIRKIISIYVNDVIYALNAYEEVDRIGMLPSFIELADNREKKNIIENTLLPFYFKLQEYSNIELFDERKFNAEITNIINNNCSDKIIDNILKTYVKKDDIKELLIVNKKDKDLDLSEKVNDESSIYQIIKNIFYVLTNEFDEKINFKDSLKFYNKNKNRYKNILKNIPFIKMVFSLENVYDTLRILSSVRQFAAHGYKINISDNKLLTRATNDINKFFDDFYKVNKKNIYIVNKYYNNNSSKEFRNFILYDKAKTLPISINKISNLILEDLSGLNTDIKSKVALLLPFIIYKHYQKNYPFIFNDNIDDKNKYNDFIKEFKSAIDKDELYLKKKEEIRKKIDLNKLIKLINDNIKKKDKDFNTEENDSTIKINISNELKLLYVFSIYLPKKEANSLFSNLITKLNSINDLVKLVKKFKAFDIALDNELIKDEKYKSFFNFENAIKSDELYFYEYDNLNLLKSLRNKQDSVKKLKGEITSKDLKNIFNSFENSLYDFKDFDSDLNKDEKGNKVTNKKLRKVKPLKQFLRNQVYSSKYYQYIDKYTNTSICKYINKNGAIIRYVLNNMLKNDEKNNVTHQYDYLKGIYERYSKEQISDKSEIVEKLIKALGELNLKNIKDSIFNELTYDYKSLVSLYFNISYQVVKGIINVNSTYFLAFEEYINLCDKDRHLIGKNPIYDFKFKNEYQEDNKVKKDKFINQLNSLDNKKEIKFINNNTYIFKNYRNFVEHVNVLMKKQEGLKNIFDKLLKFNYEELSFFKIYNLILGLYIDGFIKDYPLEENNKNFQNQVIALNYIFAYNPARFNRITIEKYYNNRWE